MAVAWTTITNAQVAAGAALTTALATALRDNPEGIAQRASGAPKIFGVPYDYQEFTSSGTWTKPSNAESGDKVFVHVVGGGGAGRRATSGAFGAGGGGGMFFKVDDIDQLGSTEAVTVGAGGVATTGDGGAGGDSSFASAGDKYFATGKGGAGSGSVSAGGEGEFRSVDGQVWNESTFGGGNGDLFNGGSFNDTGPIWGAGIYGGGAGAEGGIASSGRPGAPSAYAGAGGDGTPTTGTLSNYAVDASFPGGGGGGVDTGVTGDTVGGEGADGVVRVWCIREEA